MTQATSSNQPKLPSALQAALGHPSGARFYKCALQVNPFGYVQTHCNNSRFNDEESYNTAIVKACLANAIEVVAITDHYRVRHSEMLARAINAAGIVVLPGFEAVTKDGVHFLCIFDRDKPWEQLERCIGACDILDSDAASPTGGLDSTELLEKSKDWGCVFVAAHAAHPNGGLLKKLSGQTRVKTWSHPRLLACALPGSIDDAPEELRPILSNKDAAHRRDRPVAVVNASDVSAPQDLEKQSSSCWIKMSQVTAEGMRQAFLDPDSRIRLHSDPVPEEHSELAAIAWQGGFLDGASIHFNENLNVLIGGRGAGKSTVIESIRYVLGIHPLGEEAQRAHTSIMKDVLQSGTKISLLINSHRPSPRQYVVERTVPNPPVVRDESGEVISLEPLDLIPGVEVYGQHEISELTKSKDKLTVLLRRFVDHDDDLESRKQKLQKQLNTSRRKILDAQRETAQVSERLASLPSLEETLKRFQEAGLEDKLKEQSLLVREERVLVTARERVTSIIEAMEVLQRSIPIDRAFLSRKSLDPLPGKEILTKADTVLQDLDSTLERLLHQIEVAIQGADAKLRDVEASWGERKNAVQEHYEQILRELQKSRVDGEEFIRLRRQIEELRPLKEREKSLNREIAELLQERRNLVAEWDDTNGEEFRSLQAAAKRVSRALRNRVRVTVKMRGNREPLMDLLRENVGARLAETQRSLADRDDLSLSELASMCRKGKDALIQSYRIPPAQAQRLAEASPELAMQIEELYLDSTTAIELNTAAYDEDAQWQTLDQLSTGQKATAVLLLLLLESDAPLIVDQPEDDLDNRFITEGVVPKMREEKRRRQFLFSTHNANIPVLGDAELIVGLSTCGDAEQVHGRAQPEYMGSIDSTPVRTLVEELLEGGKIAFETRRLKYGF
jgi:DNA repair ATPase RecN